MKQEKNWKQSSFVFVKLMDFPDHACIAVRQERAILHLQKQRNEVQRKSEQRSVSSYPTSNVISNILKATWKKVMQRLQKKYHICCPYINYTRSNSTCIKT